MKNINVAEKNGQWKGNKVGYSGLHDWVRRRLIPPKKCRCGYEGKLDLANKSGKYLRNLSEWEWLCRRCHMESDGRLKNLIAKSDNQKGKKQTEGRIRKRVESRKKGAGYNQPRDINGRYIRGNTEIGL